MAKLNKAKAKEVDQTAGFEPIPEGVYHAVLMDVQTDRSGPAGAYWSWQYRVIEPSEFKGRQLWNNTTLAEGKMFGLKQTFDAFSVATDTDTDDLCGRIVKLVVGQRVIDQGTRKGEMANNIQRVMKADEGIEIPAGSNTPHPDDVFGT